MKKPAAKARAAAVKVKKQEPGPRSVWKSVAFWAPSFAAILYTLGLLLEVLGYYFHTILGCPGSKEAGREGYKSRLACKLASMGALLGLLRPLLGYLFKGLLERGNRYRYRCRYGYRFGDSCFYKLGLLQKEFRPPLKGFGLDRRQV